MLYRRFCFLVILLFASATAYAITVKSIQDGNFFDAGVWEGNELPDLNSDSILIKHKLNFNEDIHLTGSTFVHITECGRICGNYDLYLDTTSAHVWNEGEIYARHMEVQGYILNNNYLDGFTLHVFNTGFVDITGNGAELYIHPGEQGCQGPWSSTPDTSFTFSVFANTVYANVKPLECDGFIDFGDGSPPEPVASQNPHKYAHYGEYLVKSSSFCNCDTLYQERLVQIDSVCTAGNNVDVFPNPNSGSFKLHYTTCKTGYYSARLINSAGELISFISFPVNTITTDFDFSFLNSGVYFILFPTELEVKPKKVVIVPH